ncbi:MAG: hypothetical protein IKX70_04805 [Treponema sp.]|nr:hypothetical protein [Treponema sp.]
MDNNELEEKLIGNALNYQKTLAKILGPLNEMNPIANVIEEQQKLAHGISEACRKATLSAKNLSFPKITVTYPDKVNEVPMIENRELYLAKDSERQINELKDEIISLKAEIKTDREERKMKGFIEYPEMVMEHPELIKEMFERAIIKTETKQDFSPQEILVLSYCSGFRKDYQRLIEIGYMRKIEDGFLEWLKSKQSLAEYFGSQQHGKWRDIENLFKEKNLNHLLSVAEKQSKDFIALQELLNL